ncbi:3',5'-cyclic-AMP phosphodiesterase [Celerinatantimonas yamalensis]|uniref:3',5'-cyclic adenosine monophosphate phosphodiesterase CpdA n=1 Tax=Celerinatantimonas yamalensis TaxID=559956 RepID=A0ABW9G5Q7_9GAMM
MEFEKIFTHADANGELRLLQLTDTHLFANQAMGLLGVNTFASLQAVVAQIQTDSIAFDWIMATGDISQDHSARSYQRFVDTVQALGKPILWLPGNHDMQPLMSQTFSTNGVCDTKQVVSDHWQLILLDTQVPEKPHGYLSDGQLQFLAGALDDYPDKNALVLMHHQSRLIGCRWLDQHNLKNSDAFHQVLQGRSNVKAVLFGHIHQNYEYQCDGVAYIASPSTCIQFLPLSDDFALDQQQPGYRYLTLKADGTISSRVKRLSGQAFLPDNQSQGY